MFRIAEENDSFLEQQLLRPSPTTLEIHKFGRASTSRRRVVSIGTHKLLHFNDNNSEAACLGHSPQVEPSPLVGVYWQKDSKVGIDVCIDNVGSKSNLANGSNRFDYSLVSKLGGVHAAPPSFSPS